MEEIELIDIADDLLIVNKTTIDRLFALEKQNELVLYLFYYKTAKWQKHNPIKANDEYCKRCLHWGSDKLKEAKQKLKEMELIAIEKRFNDKHRLEGWYVRVNYLIENSTIPKTTTPNRPQVEKEETNTNNNNTINTNNNKNTNKRNIYKEKYGTYGRIKLTIDEYLRLVNEFGEDFIKQQIDLLDEYVESNNNKNKYTNFNLVLRKSIRENWFKQKENTIKDLKIDFMDVIEKGKRK